MDDVPDHFLCPISMELMVSPMVTRYGHNFERAAILAWMHNGSDECPLTRQPLSLSGLIPNHCLAVEISAWKTVHGLSEPPLDRRNDDHDVNAMVLNHMYGTSNMPFTQVIPAYGYQDKRRCRAAFDAVRRLQRLLR